MSSSLCRVCLLVINNTDCTTTSLSLCFLLFLLDFLVSDLSLSVWEILCFIIYLMKRSQEKEKRKQEKKADKAQERRWWSKMLWMEMKKKSLWMNSMLFLLLVSSCVSCVPDTACDVRSFLHYWYCCDAELLCLLLLWVTNVSVFLSQQTCIFSLLWCIIPLLPSSSSYNHDGW